MFGELLHVAFALLAAVERGEDVEELHEEVEVLASDTRHREDGTDAETWSDTVTVSDT